MTDPIRRRLSIDADLRLSVDGVDATLVGQGSDLTVRTDDPIGLVSAARRGGLLPRLRELDRSAVDAPFGRATVTLEGPRGRIATLSARRRPGTHGAPRVPTVLWYRPHDLIPAPAKWAAAALALIAVAIIRRRRS